MPIAKRQDNEIEFSFSPYGLAYIAGLPDRICARQTVSIFENNEVVNDRLSRTAKMIP